ncbi:acyloxyacyl hydrolase [Ramlibacter alkalitolerans]|uniref:Lipid A deacylase n=1 Tax=Ramlibacter alkalitolerans TaxID=2039631 RepID=A0ABS1JN30_9BURK|nr:acyloxyacyl hydrolase [Ramlibacter alkalitolerans]MBL0425660.1 acyloxyacyl hydrolase [Ramlibacter alkalitolerans]
MKSTTILLAGVLLAATGPALAVDLKPRGASIEVGVGQEGSRMAGIGLVWDWDFERLRRHAELTAHTEVLINRWRYDAVGGGSDELTQLVLLPTVRMRLARGASPWFIEMGVGVSYLDRDYVTPGKQFSTRWNFYDVLGVGHTFGGRDGRHELGLRWNHTSNAGIRNPNPGQNFFQLRYVHRF